MEKVIGYVDVWWCSAAFVLSWGELQIACRTMTGSGDCGWMVFGDGGWCRDPFVLSCGELPVACKTTMGCGDGGLCRDTFVYSCGVLSATCRTMTGKETHTAPVCTASQTYRQLEAPHSWGQKDFYTTLYFYTPLQSHKQPEAHHSHGQREYCTTISAPHRPPSPHPITVLQAARSPSQSGTKGTLHHQPSLYPTTHHLHGPTGSWKLPTAEDKDICTSPTTSVFHHLCTPSLSYRYLEAPHSHGQSNLSTTLQLCAPPSPYRQLKNPHSREQSNCPTTHLKYIKFLIHGPIGWFFQFALFW